MGFISSTRHHTYRGWLILFFLLLLILGMVVISMNVGEIRLTPTEVFQTLFGMGTEQQSLILFEFRLPRMILSILVGASLAVSGCILQGISRNALADPGILGINVGAGVFVMIFLTFFPSALAAPVFLLPFIALFGAGVTAFLIYLLSYKRGQGIAPIRLILVGIAISMGASAAIILFTYLLEPDQYQFAATWLAGSFWGATWKFVLALLPWVCILIPFVIYKAQTLNLFRLGDQLATGLGVSIERERLLLLIAAVGLAGSAVAVSGSISFVGLIGAHLAKRLVGSNHQWLLPTAALIGSLLLITSDLLGRILLSPAEIPTGIVVAVISAPYFLYLLARSND